MTEQELKKAHAEADYNYRREQTTPLQMQGCLGGRKMWGELSIEEKIERTREEVKRQHELISSLFRAANNLDKKIDELRSHQHGEDGRVMIPIELQPKNVVAEAYRSACEPVDPEKVYF